MNTESQHNANSANNIVPVSATGRGNKYKNFIPHRSNTTYIFIPFTIDGVTLPRDEDFSYYLSELKSKLDNNQYMVDPEDSPRYLYRYVIEKMMPVSDKPRCLHYIIRSSIFAGTKYASDDDTYRFAKSGRHPHSNLKEEFYIRFDRIHLYCFSTSVCILAFQVYLMDSADSAKQLSEPMDPLLFSGRQYSLKNVYENNLYSSNMKDKSDAFSFLALSKKILNTLLDEHYTLFYYSLGATQNGKDIDPDEVSDFSQSDSANSTPAKFQPRANMYSYLEVPSKTKNTPLINEYEKELYYLRNCYERTYTYYRDPESTRLETHCTNREICWGFTPEAAICLACPEKQEPGITFIEKVFYKNFNRDYLLMYIMLLHQKYAIYMFLTKVNAGIDQIDDLERYQEEVRRFEMDFMYTHITEVPQYQKLYEKIWAVFAIEDIFTDVLEPLDKLSETRRRNYEQQQQRENDSMNYVLSILAGLSIFSALVDCYDLVGSLVGGDWGVEESITMQIQHVLIALIVIVFFLAVIRAKFKKRK